MVKEDKVNKICISRGMKRNSVSTVPTWIDDMFREGIELQSGKLIPFWIINGVRNYTEPTGEKIKKTISLIMEVDDGSGIIPEIVNEKIETGIIKNLSKVLEGKRIIIPQDMEELKQMSTFDRMLLFQKTPQKFIKKKTGRGGEQHYVEGHTMKLEAWLAFLGQVSSHIDAFLEDADGVTCYGSITVPVDGILVTCAGCGIDLQEYKKGTKEPVFTLHELRKNAVTDMKKKILADMGFNRDVYSGEYD